MRHYLNTKNHWLIVAATVALIVGVKLSRVIEAGVGVEKVALRGPDAGAEVRS